MGGRGAETAVGAAISRNRWMVAGEKLGRSGVRTVQAMRVPEVQKLAELLGEEGGRADDAVQHQIEVAFDAVGEA